jgi:cell fate (sporulation/competence/biofilm development) regulator YlbF (YheA/YmcA/DUF963 family)
MLDTEIIALTYELKEKLINSKEYKDVKEKEKIMEEKCAHLLIKYNHLMDEYNNAVRFEKYGGDVEGSRKRLAECKMELDTNEYVKSYNEAYKKMNKLLRNLEDIIFEGLIKNTRISLD